jgi:putative membrane protein insertion efficiency factor
MQTVLVALLRFYKLAVSPMLGQRCRFYPSCSDYAREAIQYHGAAHGNVSRRAACVPLSSVFRRRHRSGAPAEPPFRRSRQRFGAESASVLR